jgi:hypothetical protein
MDVITYEKAFDERGVIEIIVAFWEKNPRL